MNNNLEKFLEASYQENPAEIIDDYRLDKEISSPTVKVYVNPNTQHTIVSHRGTKELEDWKNNLAYMAGVYEQTDRYKKGKKAQEKAYQKYGKDNVSTIGHSQGAILARKLGKKGKEVVTVNPAYTLDLKDITNPSRKEFTIRTSNDVVSSLYEPVRQVRKILYPNFSKNHDITVRSKSNNLLREHSYKFLNNFQKK